ncbi:MAG: MarR family transcriptional regulator [Anaerolineaceae bacterium]|nr:MAG: MarR family transcriptional regulator [Anaerolineaceae bacterium]
MKADPFVYTLKEWTEVSMRHSMRNILHYARECGLSMSNLGAIFHIHRIGSCGVTEVGAHLGVTSAAASQMLDRLVQQDLILRTEDPDDRRVKQIALTEKGHRILEEGLHARQGWIDELAQNLSDSEKETIISGLNILIDKVSHLALPIEVRS